jgi:hypothetical protein
MLSRRMQLCGGVVLVVAAAGAGFLFAQRGPGVAPETLLPRDAVIYAGIDGGTEHLEAWKKTAAYEALYESGLMDVVTKTVTAIQQQSGGDEGIPGQFVSSLSHVVDHGVSLAVTLGNSGGPPSPWAIVVLHDAAELEARLGQIATGAARGEINFETRTEGARTITRGMIPNSPGVEIAWWNEKGHLVVVAGINAVKSAIGVADGGANITASPLWKQYATDGAGFDVTSVGWLDFAAVRKVFGGMPLPGMKKGDSQQPVTINEITTIVGLDSLKIVAARSGYKGRALWSEMNVDAPRPRKGLLSLSDQETMTLADLPALPDSTSGFGASSFDWGKAYTVALDVAHGIETLMPESERGHVDRALDQARQVLGFDIKADLLEALGNIHCVYADSNQMPFGLGFGILVEVDDAAKLRKSVDAILAIVEREARGDVVIRRIEKHGQPMILLEVAEGGMTPAISIGDKWLSLGIVPQTVDAFLMRQTGKLKKWEPSEEVKEALAEVPQKFTAITVSNPRATYQLALGFAPFLVGGAQAGLRQSGAFPPDFQLPVSVADVPPAELVTRPLFANVSVAEVDADGITYTSRISLPAAPFTGAVDGGTALTTTAVMVALLLPAVQQAREAARRTQSKNNLKQIMLALHNYHDVYGMFPEGTHPNEKLKSEERLSWQAKVLPFVDQAPLFNMIDFEEGWEDEPNAKLMKTKIPVYQNPSAIDEPGDYGTTHYVGIAGLGKDGPELPVTSRKAGIFAYNRGTKIQDIQDGTSNTIAVTDATGYGPWGAGGKSTIRSLTEKPYINGPDGIGGPHVGGISAALADGSVRFISENIDPTVFEALTTIRGGEVVGPF